MSGPGGVMAALDRGGFTCGDPTSEISRTRVRIFALASALERAQELLELIAHISPLDEPKAGSVGEAIRTALAGFFGTSVQAAGAPSAAVVLLQLLVAWNHDVNGSGDELGRLCAAAEGMVGSGNATDPPRYGAELVDLRSLLLDCDRFMSGFEDDTDTGNAEVVAPILKRIRAILEEPTAL